MKGEQSVQYQIGDDLVQMKRPKNEFLLGIDQAIDWAPLEERLGNYYSHTGRPSHPPLVVFKMLLLQQWYRLSDEEVEFQSKDRLSFQQFLGLGLGDVVPDAASLVRLRKLLARDDQGEQLFKVLTAQFESRGLIVKRGTLVDASVVPSARRGPPKRETAKDTSDREAGWTVKKEVPVHSYKAHMATDREHDLIRDISVTPANVHDSQCADEMIQWDEGAVYADKAYDSEARREELKANKIWPCIHHKARRNAPLTAEQERANKRYTKIRAAVERPFAWWKAHFNFRRCRYVGLAKNITHVYLLAFAYNLKRSLSLDTG